jgi:hypothetical protein
MGNLMVENRVRGLSRWLTSTSANGISRSKCDLLENRNVEVPDQHTKKFAFIAAI